jgi:crotonobetainyl-CoA:carnitine CoA-transferase CaiB-like acyl-CoA transferase
MPFWKAGVPPLPVPTAAMQRQGRASGFSLAFQKVVAGQSDVSLDPYLCGSPNGVSVFQSGSFFQMATSLPLEGITVVELGHSVAAPYAGQILGDLGARVVKIEKPGTGDDARSWGPPFVGDMSACFLSLNRNKQSVELDLKDETARAALRSFVKNEADVVLQNLRPGAVAEFALDAATLREENKRLIYCNMGAFGATGPLAVRPGYDPLMQAAGGIMSITGEAGRPPVRVGVSLVDMGTAMWAVIGILAALQTRGATGAGCVVDVSLYETALALMSVHIANYGASGDVPLPYGSGAPITAPYQAFKARDGYLVIAAGNTSQFHKLCEVLERPSWRTDARFDSNELRLRNKVALAEAIEAELAANDVQTWVAALEQAGVPCAPIRNVSQVVGDPQTVALGILQQGAPGQPQLIGLPLSFDAKRPALRHPPPALGAHSHEVLRNAHLSPGGTE